ncbi:MAG: BspA family leucine-rich repeat surface protein [Paracoccaceae bacterium]
MIIRISIILVFTLIFVNFGKTVAANCYTASVNTIGTSSPCTGMLIVDFNMLSTALNNRTYAIEGPDGVSYTLTDSAKNVFTGQLTTMENLFRYTRFTGDINYWDVSNVTNLIRAFRDNRYFNGDLSSWDVSSVTNMMETFRGTVFNGDITSWDVSSVTNMYLTFYNNRNFNQNITGWDVSNVTTFNRTFLYATGFDQDIRAWSVKSNASFSYMFYRADKMKASPYIAPNTPTSSWFVIPDTTAPTLSNVSIASNNANTSKATPSDVVTLSFTASETIQSPTVTASSGGAAVNGNITVSNTSGNNWTASFTANANDTAGPVTYRIAFSDTAGNAGTPVTSTTDSSNVAVVIDSELPTLLSSTPSDGSRAVKLDQNIVLKFSEAVTAGSGKINLFDASGELVEAFTVSPSIISGATVTLNPSADFASRSAYYIQIPSTAFVDAAGNGYAGISNKTGLDFVTLDVNAPSLISSVPSDNAASVKLDKNIILTFSESVVAGSGDIKLFDGNGRLVEAFTVSSSIISGATVTLNPAADLKTR